MAVKSKENILGHLFRLSPIVEKVISNAENHGLVFLHNAGKRGGITPNETGGRPLALP